MRYGRSAPDYRSTNSHSVTVRLPGGEADLGLVRVVIEEKNRSYCPLPVDSLIALGQLRQERRLDTATLARTIQRDEAIARSVLERLVEAGLVKAPGVKKERTYTLSPKFTENWDNLPIMSGKQALNPSSKSKGCFNM